MNNIMQDGSQRIIQNKTKKERPYTPSAGGKKKGSA